MATCDCNRADCVTCLIQNTVPQEASSFMRPGIDAVIFTVRLNPMHNEAERELANAKLWATHATLDNLAFLLQELGLQTSLTTRQSISKPKAGMP